MKFRVFWDVAPCSDVEVDRSFRGAYSFGFLHYFSLRGNCCLEVRQRFFHFYQLHQRLCKTIMTEESKFWEQNNKLAHSK
jgi:hypothetical protein